MRRILLLICALWLALPLPVQAYELLIIKSQSSKVYDEILHGLRSVRKFSERVINLADFAEADIKRIVKEDRPSAVITFGDLSLESARMVTNVPVVPLMAISYRQESSGSQNLSGIDVLIPADRYITLFKQMRMQRVGVLYSKEKTGNYLQHAKKVAAKFGVVLIPREVTSPKEVFTQLESLKGSIDGLWMLPDSRVISQMTAEAFANFSMQQNVPLVSYASVYLSHGASAVIEIDRTDLGVQAAEMVVNILDRENQTVESAPRKAVLRLNQAILKRHGVSSDVAAKIQQNWE